jgi:hypothetical protein
MVVVIINYDNNWSNGVRAGQEPVGFLLERLWWRGVKPRAFTHIPLLHIPFLLFSDSFMGLL